MDYFKKLDVKLVKGKYPNLIKGQIRNSKQIYQIFQSPKNKSQETLIVVYLDKNLKSLAYNVLSTGSLNSTDMSVREVFGYGFVMMSKYFILIHNHPAGNANPSLADQEAIQELLDARKIMRLYLLDFIIIGDSPKQKKKY